MMWLIAGGTAGWMVSSYMAMPESLPFNIIVGIIGAFVADFGLTVLSDGISAVGQANFSLSTLLVSWVGSIILLVILNFFRGRAGLLR
jgi:uncharacterized membrane protein YeaQ/YmgE (transglycosylase-associated protein family)